MHPQNAADERLRPVLVGAVALLALLALPVATRGQAQRVFDTPEAAVRALIDAAKAADVDRLVAIFGADGRDLVSSSDRATARNNRETFVVATAEGWRLVDKGTDRKELVIGNEAWPFPVPLMKSPKGWVFDTPGGREEVLARRIGRNELATIEIAQRYVAAQRAYASQGHDGRRSGIYARRFASEAGSQNGLYWPSRRGEPLSPLGPLVAEAAAEGRPMGLNGQGPVPFHGYYFRILDGQGPAAPGGARSYLVNGEMTGGFALVAWPVQYDITGIMTFIVNEQGVVYEKDLGPDTLTAVAGITRYNPDKTWNRTLTDASRP